MDIHHLRVVNFDNMYEDDQINIPLSTCAKKPIEKCEIKPPEHMPEKNHQTKFIRDDGKVLESNHPSYKEKDGGISFHKCTNEKDSDKTQKLHVPKYYSRLHTKRREVKKEGSNTIDFKRSRKTKKYKYSSIIFFDNFMKTLSVKNDDYFTRIQDNLQKFRKYSNLFTPRNKNHRELKHHKISPRLPPNEVKVLYVSETAKSHRRPRKHSPNKHSSTCNLHARIKSFSSHDIFGFQRSKHAYNRNLYYNERQYDVNFSNTRYRKSGRYIEQCPKYQPRRSFIKIRKVKSSTSDRFERPMHFHLVDFPSVSNTCDPARSCFKIRDVTGDFVHRPCKNKGVLVTPSRFQVSKKMLCDTSVLTSQSLQGKRLSSCQTSAHRYQKSLKTVPSTSYTPAEIFNKMFYPIKYRSCVKRQSSAKNIIKYFLIGLMAVVWFPCVMSLGLIWLLTYLMRPHYNSPNMNVYHPKYTGRNIEKGCLTTFINFMKQVVKETLSSLGSMIKPKDIKSQKFTPLHRTHTLTKPCGTACRTYSQPDPNKQYTLYYAGKRGWMMKPKRRRFAKKKATLKRNICNGLDILFQKFNILTKGEVIIAPDKRHDSFNKLNSNCPCMITRAHEQPHNTHAMKSEKNIKESSLKPVSMKKSKLCQKYNASSSVQSQGNQGVLSQQASPPTKINAAGPTPSANKSPTQRPFPEKLPQQISGHSRILSQRPSPEKLSPLLLHSCRLPSAKRLISRGASSPERCKTGCKSTGTKTPTKEKLLIPIMKDRRKTQNMEERRKMMHFSNAELEKATRCLKMETSRRSKRSQCNFTKKKVPARPPCSKKKGNAKNLTYTQKVYSKVKEVWNFFKSLEGNDYDNPDYCDIKCQDLYVSTLKKKPCFCIYNCCPTIYPFFLMWQKCTMDCFHIMMYICTFCIWTPVLLSCYTCYWFCCFVFFR